MKNIIENVLLLTAPELNSLVPQTKPRQQQKYLIIYPTKKFENEILLGNDISIACFANLC